MLFRSHRERQLRRLRQQRRGAPARNLNRSFLAEGRDGVGRRNPRSVSRSAVLRQSWAEFLPIRPSGEIADAPPTSLLAVARTVPTENRWSPADQPRRPSSTRDRKATVLRQDTALRRHRNPLTFLGFRWAGAPWRDGAATRCLHRCRTGLRRLHYADELVTDSAKTGPRGQTAATVQKHLSAEKIPITVGAAGLASSPGLRPRPHAVPLGPKTRDAVTRREEL